MREQQVLYEKSVDALPFKIVGRNTARIMAHSDCGFRDEPNVMTQRHSPPKISILDMQPEAVSAEVQGLLHTQSYGRMTDGQQIARQGKVAKSLRRTPGGSEVSEISALSIIAGI